MTMYFHLRWTITTMILVFLADAYAPLDPVQFYKKECPRARRIVGDMVLEAIRRDIRLSAALLRLQFHDCFVRGCDASILLDSNSTNLAEKDGAGNVFSVRGYEVIDNIKEALEAVCPQTVSCADIIILASRDAIASIGGPSWSVTSGRFDAIASYAEDNLRFLPPPSANFSLLSQMFAQKGFSEREMVVLSGAHTIGITHCGLIQNRLYNGTCRNNIDPTLDPAYAVELRRQCAFGNVSKPLLLNPTSGGYSFDSSYYTNLLRNRGILESDATLITEASGREFALEAAFSPSTFFSEFASGMEKLSNLEVKNATEGEIRRSCRFTN
ncbi:peroxidase [Marchantia polymorpha subsp. ruderalis]|uniref:Peroxidase n=2 Tax=Marchantia polymorpha TaxID=3197 RepID=A0AAF6B6N0_MARPO|nr:hypothetical protein MARPO_0087s0046 [Marchantia polymorpha]PTQ33609.1 hypothetical protein MARPO_0087s0046 [Marchantia polymorpha]BBN07663.1 hypothetical protein Mp_4g05440 [Marchantia polymorpha subsp. ruderalis]BBN07664.1 hypothetical protein Mp_4g05440 [Marchantia polymorpha subsp. ruderalis]|eukprot:PTQ33608.1 hypothetical protein MARPO_0087s0046 [Marchantia polymorpha]